MAKKREGREAVREASRLSANEGVVRPHDLRRGNDLLFKARGEFTRFDHYLGPFGGGNTSSIEGAQVNNRDDAGSDQVYNKRGKGILGKPRTRSTRGDETDY